MNGDRLFFGKTIVIHKTLIFEKIKIEVVKNCKKCILKMTLLVLLFFNANFSFSQSKGDTLSKESFEKLFEKYHTNVEFRAKYYSLKKHVNFDSIPKEDLNNLLESISKEYDIAKLSAEREVMLAQIKRKKNIARNNILYAGIIVFVLILGFAFQFIKRKKQDKKFKELYESQTSVVTKKQLNGNEINIPKKIREEIINHLEAFEIKQQFISSDYTLNSLAKEFNTNANYLSKVINHYKKQSFTNYLTNLRVSYAIDQLKNNVTFRKYTIKAISEEVGFKTPESFAKAFYELTGIRPSYFIKELENRN